VLPPTATGIGSKPLGSTVATGIGQLRRVLALRSVSAASVNRCSTRGTGARPGRSPTAPKPRAAANWASGDASLGALKPSDSGRICTGTGGVGDTDCAPLAGATSKAASPREKHE